jgi:hypothetical protein
MAVARNILDGGVRREFQLSAAVLIVAKWLYQRAAAENTDVLIMEIRKTTYQVAESGQRFSMEISLYVTNDYSLSQYGFSAV